MVSTRRNCFKPDNETLDSEQSSSHIFQTLLSAIESPDGLRASLLKCLYYLLIHASLNPLCPANKGADLNERIMEIGQNGIRLTIKDTCRLSNVLFKELCKRFKQLLSAAHDVSKSRVFGQPSSSLDPDMWAADEELNLLLRCCMVFLNLLVWQQHLLLEKGRVLLMILKKLSLFSLSGGSEKSVINFVQLFSRECMYSDNDCAVSFTEEFVTSLSFLEPSDPHIPTLFAMLEVFLDELLVHKQLREYLKRIDSVCSTSEMLFMHHSSHDNIGLVIEVMSAHFSLSISDEQACEDFINRLSWLHRTAFRTPELSLTAAISLLRNPIMLCAPKLMQAHMISLVSEAIGSDMNFESLNSDSRHMDCYLLAFERSVVLYTKHMSSVQINGHPPGARAYFAEPSICGENFQPSFGSYLQPVTKMKINNLITKLDDSWHSHLRSRFFKTKSDLVTSAIAYIKENQDILDKSCRDEILLTLSCMILRAPSDANDIALNVNENSSLEDICLLASLLKLMSNSLLQALWCLRPIGNLGCPKTLKDFPSCKEYDSIASIISCFGKFNIHLPIQKSFCDMMEGQPKRHKESNLMLLHFLGLLSLSFVSGLDFLVKGCILIVMALMNLFVFEEGNLDGLRLLIDSRLEPFSDGLPLANAQKDVVDRKSSLVVASKFQKIHTLHLSISSLASNCTGVEDGCPENLPTVLVPNNVERIAGIEEEAEICNGEIFLKSVLELPKSSDVDDLADFIECKPGKDYSGWLKGRQKYRKWKCEKMAALMWQKKKKTWKFMKRNKI